MYEQVLRNVMSQIDLFYLLIDLFYLLLLTMLGY